MFNKRVFSIFKREIKEKLLSKSFIIMTVLIPVFIFGVLGFQTFIMTYEDGQKQTLVFASPSTELLDLLKKEFEDMTKDGKYTFLYQKADNAAKDAYLKERKDDILEERITGIVFINDSSLINKQVMYYSKNPNNVMLFDKLKGRINNVLIINFFKGQLGKEQIEFARKEISINPHRISKDDDISKEGFGNVILSYLFTFLLYMSLLIVGTQMMRSVVEEKTNRIVEVLLSSVNSRELMMGKIFGTAVTGMVQMIIWLTPMFVLISTTIFQLPEELNVKIEMSKLFYFLLNYFLGIVTFMGLFASVGAIFDNDQDAQTGVWPIMILIMVPFFISIGMITNPENSIAKIASMFPFASIIVMPARVTLTDVPMYELLLSIGINILVLFFIIWLASKIYRIGILITGRKPKWGEVARWLKM